MKILCIQLTRNIYQNQLDHEANFSLFHANIRSLSKHFDELQSLLSATKTPFDIIGLTESKQSIDKDFLTNVKINDYRLHIQPSKSSSGGIAIYIKKSSDHSVLSNFKATEDEYEALWVEINTGQKVEIVFVVVLIVILILMQVSFLNTWSQSYLNLKTKINLFASWEISI